MNVFPECEEDPTHNMNLTAEDTGTDGDKIKRDDFVPSQEQREA